MEEELIKRILPHSDDAERSVIGCMMMNREAIMIASEILTGDEFYRQQMGIVFDSMVELYNEGKPVDFVTLPEKLKEKDVPPEISSMEFAKDLLTAVPTSVNVGHYAKIVKEKAMLRRLIKMNEDIANTCYLDKEPVEEIMEDTEKQLFQLLQTRTGGDYVPIRQVVLNALETIEKASQTKGTVTGIPTGFVDLDYKTSGLQPSDFILVAARPSMGKTAFVLNIAHHVAVRKGIATAIFNLEMSKEQLVTRMIAMDSLVDSQKVQTGQLAEDDWDQVLASAESIAAAPLYIEDSSALTISELRSKCRQLKSKNNLGLIIIDYLQLMSTTGRVESRQQFVSDMSRSLKMLARELDVPIIALSQLNREVDKRPDHKPVLADLRESGSIEQDADVVMFIYRDDYYNPDTDKKGISEIIIAKQRKGATGSVDLVWLQEYTKFANKEH